MFLSDNIQLHICNSHRTFSVQASKTQACRGFLQKECFTTGSMGLIWTRYASFST